MWVCALYVHLCSNPKPLSLFHPSNIHNHNNIIIVPCARPPPPSLSLVKSIPWPKVADCIWCSKFDTVLYTDLQYLSPQTWRTATTGYGRERERGIGFGVCVCVEHLFNISMNNLWVVAKVDMHRCFHIGVCDKEKMTLSPSLFMPSLDPAVLYLLSLNI